MNGTTSINSGQVSHWDDMVGTGTSPSSMSKSIRSITSSGDAYMGFVDSLEPRGYPAKSNAMQSDRGTVSLVVVTRVAG
jgi:ketopantoate hydroxymethyltransferase